MRLTIGRFRALTHAYKEGHKKLTKCGCHRPPRPRPVPRKGQTTKHLEMVARRILNQRRPLNA